MCSLSSVEIHEFNNKLQAKPMKAPFHQQAEYSEHGVEWFQLHFHLSMMRMQTIRDNVFIVYYIIILQAFFINGLAHLNII